MTEANRVAADSIGPRERIIVALDVTTAAEARSIVTELEGKVAAFKIGLQLFASAGPGLVRKLCDAGHKIFLDLKFHDIPNTVASAGVEAARLGVWMFNVHALGGAEMMRRVASEVGDTCHREALARPKILGVTVLTSSTDDGLREIGIERKVESQVQLLARLAEAAELDGVVASAQEVRTIREWVLRSFMVVTPGIRLGQASNDDQERVATPGEAIANGADLIVVGRPVLKAADRLAMLERIVAEIGSKQ